MPVSGVGAHKIYFFQLVFCCQTDLMGNEIDTPAAILSSSSHRHSTTRRVPIPCTGRWKMLEQGKASRNPCSLSLYSKFFARRGGGILALSSFSLRSAFFHGRRASKRRVRAAAVLGRFHPGSRRDLVISVLLVASAAAVVVCSGSQRIEVNEASAAKGSPRGIAAGYPLPRVAQKVVGLATMGACSGRGTQPCMGTRKARQRSREKANIFRARVYGSGERSIASS